MQEKTNEKYRIFNVDLSTTPAIFLPIEASTKLGLFDHAIDQETLH